MRFVLILLLALVPVSALADSPPDPQARPDHPGWSADAETGCWIWNPEPGADDVFHWSGGCDADGKATGQGKLEWRYGGDQLDRYEGAYRQGKMEGTGTYVWANGKRYEGAWQDGEMHGQGKYLWPDGKRFDGTWKRGNIEGLGVAVFPDGTRYDGMWKNNAFNGKGTLTDPGGDRYVGSFRDSTYDGFGAKTWSNGDGYEGQWTDDRPNGAGDYTKGGHHFSGQWANGCLRQGDQVFAIGRAFAECVEEMAAEAQ